MEQINPKTGLLIFRYLQGKLSVSEQEELDEWLQEEKHREIFRRICNKENILEKSFYFDSLGKNKEKMWNSLERATGLHRRAVLRPWLVAASLMLPLLIGILYQTLHYTESDIQIQQRNKIVPGISMAQLRLPDGEVVSLGKDKSNSLQLLEGGQFIDERGTLIYGGDSTKAGEILYSELQIPRGGEYKVVLPDNTVVWLNAESSLRFPVAFTGKERKVYAKGELYFEVKRDEKRPFVVEVGKDYTVEVLGTEFNLRAYEESPCATTLVKGSVRVKGKNNEVLLQPGEQAVCSGETDNIEVAAVHVESCIAWRVGIFYFEHATLKEIMDELARWYNVQVIFENEAVMAERFSIEMKRFDDFNQALKLIERTGMVTMAVDGRVVTIR